MLKILIYEDNINDYQNLTRCIDSFFSQNNIDYSITQCNNSKFLFNVINNFDLLFLDIEIGEENGIEIGLKIRKSNPEIPRIIITSSFSKYLLDGYKINADRYFLKPIHQNEFNIEMDAILRKYLNKYLGFYDPSISNQKILFKNIMYIEFSERKTKIHLINNRVLSTNYPLKHWINLLKNEYQFSQCHKAFIVNFYHISTFQELDITLKNEVKIPLSRHFKKELKNNYYNFLQLTI